MARTVHLSIDIQGFLMNHWSLRDYKGVFQHDDGRPMGSTEAKQFLLSELAAGKKVIAAMACDNFDDQTGCRGHEIAEPKVLENAMALEEQICWENWTA